MAQSTWIQALKIHNKGGNWCVPKKGSSEYDKVKATMDKLKRGEAVTSIKRPRIIAV